MSKNRAGADPVSHVFDGDHFRVIRLMLGTEFGKNESGDRVQRFVARVTVEAGPSVAKATIESEDGTIDAFHDALRHALVRARPEWRESVRPLRLMALEPELLQFGDNRRPRQSHGFDSLVNVKVICRDDEQWLGEESARAPDMNVAAALALCRVYDAYIAQHHTSEWVPSDDADEPRAKDPARVSAT